jgi:hypothetical protein
MMTCGTETDVNAIGRTRMMKGGALRRLTNGVRRAEDWRYPREFNVLEGVAGQHGAGATRNPNGCLDGASSHCGGIKFHPSKKILKKVLTLQRQIQYHGARFQNRQRIFAR